MRLLSLTYINNIKIQKKTNAYSNVPAQDRYMDMLECHAFPFTVVSNAVLFF